MAEKITHIYNKLFKKMLTLSSVAVMNLINGLLGTDYPTDRKITYTGPNPKTKTCTDRV